MRSANAAPFSVHQRMQRRGPRKHRPPDPAPPEQLYFRSGATTYSVYSIFSPTSALPLFHPQIGPGEYHATAPHLFLGSTVSSIMTTASLPEDPGPRQRSASRSTDDRPSTDRPRRFFRRYVRDLSISSHSLATINSHYDDLPTPSLPTYASHTTSAHSTPMTSPSTGYSSLFPGSLSSTTSESVPNAVSQCPPDTGVLASASPTSSPIPGSTSSHSSHPLFPRSQSTTGSHPQPSAPRLPSRYPSNHFPDRPSTAPHSPPTPSTPSAADNSLPGHHTRSYSRLTVTIKNLLSRSAIPSSRFSFNSTMPSDNESFTRSFHVLPPASIWPTTPPKSRPPDLEISGTVAPAVPSTACTSDVPVDPHRRHANETIAKLSQSSSLGSDGLDVPVRNAAPSSACGREPKTRNVLRRRPSGSAKLFKGRERGMSSPSCPRAGDLDRPGLPPKATSSCQGGIPFPLTAAGAVAMAYKQQELQHDDTSPPKLSAEHQISLNMPHGGAKYDQDHLERSITPPGSSPAPRMQADGLDDRSSEFDADHHIWAMSRARSSHQPSASDSVGRRVTRKVSSRWQKVKEGVMLEESPLRSKGHSKGLPSLQAIWGADKSGIWPTGRSVDAVPSAGGDASAGPIDGHATSEPEKGDGDGGRLWRFMRRISTGGLRERFQSDGVVPPVPAIPKELLENGNGSERSDTPRSSLCHQPASPTQEKELARTFTASKSSVVARPNAATTTSPNSSDVASTQFFPKTHSTHSSVSSYGEGVVVPRTTEFVLHRHIITPLEQLRLADDHTESDEPGTSSVPVSRSPRQSMSVPTGLKSVEDAESDYVPSPSPYRTCSDESPSGPSRPPSTSPSACESACVPYQSRGLGRGGSRTEDGMVPLSPPPRPTRSLRRGAAESIASSPSPPMVVAEVDDDEVGSIRLVDRVPSAQSDMTARIGSPDPGRSPGRDQEGDQRASPYTSTQPTFRKLDAPRRPPLNEREKADIWNDLLARSDRAGGTLHINGAAELMSDNMRFSTHSEV